MGEPLRVALPNFTKPIDMEERNRLLQKYRAWAYEQRYNGRPVPCWCLYIWIVGNNKDAAKTRCRTMAKKMHRPPGSTSNQWQNWRAHVARGGHLSFPEYLARYDSNAQKGQGYRQDLVGMPLGKRSIRKAKAYMVEEPEEEGIELAPEPTPKKWPQHANGKRVEQPAVVGDQGLRMEPKSVLAKFGRLGLLPKAPTRPM